MMPDLRKKLREAALIRLYDAQSHEKTKRSSIIEFGCCQARLL
jgi:transcription termination factor NusB